jgi:hypothetical protein
VAVSKHFLFVSRVATFTGRWFDSIFGQGLVSIRSVGTSACFSLASLGLVCAPALKDLQFPQVAVILYGPVITALVVAGVMPSVFGARLRIRLWLTCIALLCTGFFIGMHLTDWFGLAGREGSALTEAGYDLSFLLVTVASDTLFIVITRILLRKSSAFQSTTRVVGVALMNVTLAGALVFVPIYVPWGLQGVRDFIFSGEPVNKAELNVAFSDPGEVLLSTLAASNVIDGLVASAFFIVFAILLLHRLVWPAVERPLYAIASLGVVRRRKFFLVLGIVLIGFGGAPNSVVEFIKKLGELLAGS